jgi:hydroxymethylglutaryl-CoA synthase
MVGITSYGAYIPFWRLRKAAIAQDAVGEKAVCGFDEDAVTMAVAATGDCLNGIPKENVDGLFLASTTPPYVEKSAATTVAMGADLRREIMTVDFARSLRAGTCALQAALDAVKAGSARNIVVAGADCRMGIPGSSFERNFGDAAGALLIGDRDVIATVEASHFISEEILDAWRSERDVYVRSWEERFGATQGYLPLVREAVSGLLKKTDLTPKDFTKAIFYSPDGKRHAEIAAQLGFDLKTQVQDPLIHSIGDSGSAMPLVLLVAALEEAKAGDRILLVSYGDGSDAFSLQVREPIEGMGARRGVKVHLACKKVIDDYRKFLFWRGLLPTERRVETVSFVSVPAIHRGRDANLRLRGVKCQDCGTVQFPPQRVCTKCHSKDRFEPHLLSDKRAKVFTFSADYISNPMIERPIITTTIDFEGGGRLQCYMTDCDFDRVKPGLPVEMTFRRLISRDGIHSYAWKSTPLRTAEVKEEDPGGKHQG